MAINVYILPMDKHRRVIFIAYEGVELLDIAGPAAVFSAANALTEKQLYRLIVAEPTGSDITTTAGIVVATVRLDELVFDGADSVFAVGAYETELQTAMKTPAIRRALRSASVKAERYGAICTGTFLLAASGLLARKRATTHWAGRDRLVQQYADILIDSDELYVSDNNIWTSAGVSSGIDMALAIIEADYGTQLKSRIAKQLVVYAHRPGYQSQFSKLLSAQTNSDEHFSRLVERMANRLDHDIKVSDMAEFLGMSERSFYRRFTQLFNQTPAKFFELLRLDASKQLIEAGVPIKAVTAKVGFLSESAFRTAFKSCFDVTPQRFPKYCGVKAAARQRNQQQVRHYLKQNLRTD